MRLSTDPARDEGTALATLSAALDAGIALFDTARAYGTGEGDAGHNERLIARAWRARATVPTARVVTKCGMRRDGGGWIPDGRAKRIADDIAASVEALGGVPIDVLLLHAPDPRVPLATTGRALALARDEGPFARSASPTCRASSSKSSQRTRPSPRSKSPSERTTTLPSAAASSLTV